MGILGNAEIDFIDDYGPRCRDCADDGPICPTSGVACAGHRTAAEFAVNALNYAWEHGFLTSPVADLEARLAASEMERTSLLSRIEAMREQAEADEINLDAANARAEKAEAALAEREAEFVLTRQVLNANGIRIIDPKDDGALYVVNDALVEARDGALREVHAKLVEIMLPHIKDRMTNGQAISRINTVFAALITTAPGDGT